MHLPQVRLSAKKKRKDGSSFELILYVRCSSSQDRALVLAFRLHLLGTSLIIENRFSCFHNPFFNVN